MQILKIFLLNVILLLALPYIVKADYLDTQNTENVFYIEQYIHLRENKTANIEIEITIENDTTDSNYFSFEVNRKETQNFRNFDCNGFIRNLENNSIDSLSHRNSTINKKILIQFNHTEPSYIRLYCKYIIDNYSEEIYPSEWLIYDKFQNKHNAKHFFLYVYIPKNMIFTESNPPTRVEACNLNEDCQQKISFSWEENSKYTPNPPSIYLRYERISLDLGDIWRRHGTEFVLGGSIGAIIGLFIERLVKIFGRKIYNDIRETRKKK